MDLSTLADSTVTSLTSATTGVPALVIDLLPLLALFVGVRLAPRLIKKFAR
jgi:hypothetical protein